ncbi:MAG: hypothetical protein Kow0019_13040 [Methanobacteriaceae archaeon]
MAFHTCHNKWLLRYIHNKRISTISYYYIINLNGNVRLIMCEECDFCGEPGIDECIVCQRCYCPDHMGGDGYCVDCFFGTGLF